MTVPASSSLLLQAAASAAAGQSWPEGALYIVATPIGNLADFSLRAIQALSLAQAVACEDTRVSGGLLRHLGLEGKPLIALHEHNEHSASARVLERLARGERVAYISDAGTPAISDPGAVLVAQARAAGYRVVPLPGASSVVTALSAAGDAAAAEGDPREAGSAGFTFAGFLPAKGGARQASLAAALALRHTVVLFEAPHRIAQLMAELAQAAPQRRVSLCRELTKQFEHIHTLAAADGPAWLEADPQHRRGEFVLVLHALPPLTRSAGLPEPAQKTLAVLLRSLPLKQAVGLAAEISGESRNELYTLALALKGAVQGDDEDPRQPLT